MGIRYEPKRHLYFQRLKIHKTRKMFGLVVEYKRCRFSSQDVRTRVQPPISSSAMFRIKTHAAYKGMASSLVGGCDVSLGLQLATYRGIVLPSFPDPKSRRTMLWEPQISHITYSFCWGWLQEKCTNNKDRGRHFLSLPGRPQHESPPPPPPKPEILTTVSFRSCS